MDTTVITDATGSATPDDAGTATEQQQTGQEVQEQGQKAEQEQKKPLRSSAETFTKDDVDKIKSAQFTAGKSALLKELGITPEKGKDAAAQVAAFKAWKESQLTEAQRAQETIDALKNDFSAEQAKVAVYEKKMAAIAAGVPSDKLDWYARLAESMGGDEPFDAKLAKAIEEYPLPQKNVPKITAGQSKEGTGSSALYSMEQIKQMSQAEINKNWAAVQSSLAAHKKG